jgi:hypothetical protein
MISPSAFVAAGYTEEQHDKTNYYTWVLLYAADNN